MPYSINYNEAGYIQLVYEGDANLKDLSEVLARGMPLVKEHNCFRVLSDFRTTRLNLSVMSLFSIPENQKILSREMNMPFYKFRRAVVVPERDFEKYRFFETVAVNRSHNVKVFVEPKDAISWLLEE
jgi:hypothetical protein